MELLKKGEDIFGLIDQLAVYNKFTIKTHKILSSGPIPVIDLILFLKLANPGLFLFIFVFSTCHNLNSNLNW